MLKYSYVAVVLTLQFCISSAQISEWSVSNRSIVKDGEVFLIKGVNYAPLPPGATVSDLFHSDWAHLHDRDLPLMRAAGVNSIRIYNIQLNYPNSDIAL